MYQQDFSPVGDRSRSPLSALFASLLLITIFILIGALKVKAQWAALAFLAVSLIVAIAVYGMPVDQALLAGGEGALFGFFQIMWIVINAIWIYNMTVSTEHFDVLRRSFGSVSDDQRIQAIIIAFCFGGFPEALAGFGTPVALSSANTSGGVLGKMIPPQNLAIAAAAVGMAGQEGVLFRKVFGWSIGFLVLMAVLIYLQSTSVLSWMLL